MCLLDVPTTIRNDSPKFNENSVHNAMPEASTMMKINDVLLRENKSHSPTTHNLFLLVTFSIYPCLHLTNTNKPARPVIYLALALDTNFVPTSIYGPILGYGQ